MTNKECAAVLRNIAFLSTKGADASKAEEALMYAANMLEGRVDIPVALEMINTLAETVIGDAPNEDECTDAENEVYAELANFVNEYPDYLAEHPLNTTTNTEIEYLYRDASNYKTWNAQVLAGTLTSEQKETMIFLLEDGEYFIPEQVGLDIERPGDINEDDHCYCELDIDGITETEKKPTTTLTAQELYENFMKTGGKWDSVKYAVTQF